VSVIDTDDNMVVKTVTVGSSPDGAAFTNCTDFAYVTNEGTDNISVIDTETLAAVATITLPPGSFPDSVDLHSERPVRLRNQ